MLYWWGISTVYVWRYLSLSWSPLWTHQHDPVENYETWTVLQEIVIVLKDVSRTQDGDNSCDLMKRRYMVWFSNLSIFSSEVVHRHETISQAHLKCLDLTSSNVKWYSPCWSVHWLLSKFALCVSIYVCGIDGKFLDGRYWYEYTLCKVNAKVCGANRKW